MKKYKPLITKTISGVLSSVLIFMSIFVLFVSADEPDEIYCVSDHFSKLKENHNGSIKKRIPINGNDTTCTHISMSMLLSYYDFYWHDSFVPTIYKADGTYHQMGWENGVYNATTNTVVETFNAYPEADAWLDYEITDPNFENFASYNNMYYLQPYLMNLSDNETINDELGIRVLLDFQVVQILRSYLSDRQLGAEQGVTVHIEHASDHDLLNLDNARAGLFETIKEQIDNGNPVIFMGLNVDLPENLVSWNNFNAGGHAMVAYDVVTRNGKEDILLHNGYNGNETDYYNSTDFKYLNSAVWIEIDDEELPHVCTKKYIDSVDTTKTYCACEIYSTHKNHNSNHIYNINGLDSDTHFLGCHCGARTNVEAHDLTYSYYSPTQHYESCSECSYEEAVNHEYNILHSPTSTGHSLKCACGEERAIIEAHYTYSYTERNRLMHNKYCACGYLIGSEPHNLMGDGLNNICVHCGYNAGATGGGNIIMKDEEDYPTE